MAKKTRKDKAAGTKKPTRTRTKAAPARRKAKTTKPRKAKKAKKAKRAPRTRSTTIAPSRELAPALAPCLDQEVATAVVFACTGVGPVNPDVKLGQLFPGPTQRQGFCGCVVRGARAAGAAIAAVPCTATTSIGQVIDSLSC